VTDAPEKENGSSRLCQVYSGACDLIVLPPGTQGPRMPAAVSCRFSGLEEDYTAFIDTASDYCMMQPDVARQLGLFDERMPRSDSVTIWTWRGRYKGCLCRHPLVVPAIEGSDLELDASWFVSKDWDGPNVLGWYGCLGSMAFGCRPRVTADDGDTFYFAAL